MLCPVTPFTFCDLEKKKKGILRLLVAADGLTRSDVVELMKKLESYEEELGKMV